MASLTRWMWVWVNSGSWWWTGRPGVLRFIGRRVRQDWATELTDWLIFTSMYVIIPILQCYILHESGFLNKLREKICIYKFIHSKAFHYFLRSNFHVDAVWRTSFIIVFLVAQVWLTFVCQKHLCFIFILKEYFFRQRILAWPFLWHFLKDVVPQFSVLHCFWCQVSHHLCLCSLCCHFCLNTLEIFSILLFSTI